jgi:holo-[acyl-carrier protein] synthase
MIIGVGVDVCEVRRMARELAREDHGFRDQVFTPHEIAYCESRRYPARHYAARFAAKEAVAKALDAEPDTGSFREVEVRIVPGGRRRIVLHDRMIALARRRRVRTLHLSLSHDTTHALAHVVLEGVGDPEDHSGSI